MQEYKFSFKTQYSIIAVSVNIKAHKIHIVGFTCSVLQTAVGVQWLSGRVLDMRPKGPRYEPHQRHCLVSLSKNINPSLVLVQPRKTRPFLKIVDGT